MAQQRPERVTRLVLMAPGGGWLPFGPTPTEGQKEMFRYYNGGGPSEKKMAAFIRTMVFDHKQFGEDVVRARYEASLDESHIVFYHRYNAAFARRGGMDPLWRDLHRIKAPTLLLWGRDDRTITLDGAQLMLKHIRGCAAAPVRPVRPLGPARAAARVRDAGGRLPGGAAVSGGWLHGYAALITGGGTGIGRAVATRFLAEGASVTLFGRDRDQLDEAVAAAPDPSRIHTVTGDVRDSPRLHTAVAETVERFGKLDTLIANAGVWDYQRQLTRLGADELDTAFDEIFAINVKGYLLAAEAAWRELVKTRGSIVMTLSNASFHVNGGGPLYTASKHACLGLMRELAYELAPKVRVNGVACGGMKTDLRGPEALSLGDRSISASFEKNAARGPDAPPPHIPLYDSSTDPRDFTGSYVLLAAREQSGPITGHVISIDGGIGVRGFARAAGGDDL